VSSGGRRGRKGKAVAAGERTHRAMAASPGTAAAGSLPASFWILRVFP
jgi:hypothetical protein